MKATNEKYNAKTVRGLLDGVSYFQQQLIETRKDRDHWKRRALALEGIIKEALEPGLTYYQMMLILEKADKLKGDK